jgi:hypothetical protein
MSSGDRQNLRCQQGKARTSTLKTEGRVPTVKRLALAVAAEEVAKLGAFGLTRKRLLSLAFFEVAIRLLREGGG